MKQRSTSKIAQNILKTARPTVLVLNAAVALAAFAPQAPACAPAPMPGQQVRIAQESAIILWDKARNTEHFIRSASFDTSAKNFGFLVPTPSVPTLTQADQQVFSLLERTTLPKHIRSEERGIKFYWWLASRNKSEATEMVAAGAARPGSASSVRVLSEQTVAGYDAVVLEADNAPALRRWLADHNYDARPALIRWLAPYVAARWKVTAFKIAATSNAESDITTAPVRMSFQTSAPFFPYREPDDQHARESYEFPSSRLLRVFFIGNERVEGAFGQKPTLDRLPWPGKTTWSDSLNDDVSRELLQNVALKKEDLLALPRRMTVFEDNASPRPGIDDVYFSPSVNQQAISPPPIEDLVDVRTPVSYEGVILILGVALPLFTRGIRRRRHVKG